jgi:hypothetical protein
MATDSKKVEADEADVETTMDGGLARLDPPGLAQLEDDEDAPRPAREDG